jgi:hypothetical protein
MKTSKYIQLTLFIFILGATLTLFIKAKSYYENSENIPKFYSDVKLLDDFSVIVVKDDAKINLVNDSINSVISKYKYIEERKGKYNFEEIAVKNDTLFISKVDSKYQININTKSVKKIVGLKNSTIWFNHYYSDTVDVELTKSNLYGGLQSNLINSFKIIATNNSKINIGRVHKKVLDSVTGKYSWKTQKLIFKEAQITLKNKSTLSMPKPLRLVIDADSLSTYSVY